MPLPRRVKIGGHEVAIRLASVQELGGKEYLGEYNPDTNSIRLKRTLAKSRRVEVLLHEVFHAILVGHKYFDDEALVVLLGEGLTQIIRDNPDFIRYCLELLSVPKK